MSLSRFHSVDTGGIYATVAEEVGKADDVLLCRVISTREEVAEIVRKDLAFRYAALLTYSLHIRPDVRAVYRSVASGDEYGTTGYFPLSYVLGKHFTQRRGEKDASLLIFTVDLGYSERDRLYGYKSKLGDPYARGAYGLHK